MAEGQVEHRAVTVRQPTGSLRDQIGELGAGSQHVGACVFRLDVGQLIGRGFAAQFAKPT